MKAKCPSQINRDKMNKKPEKYLTEKMFIRDKVRKYYTCIIESIDIIGLNFELFENFNDLESNIEIFLYHNCHYEYDECFNIVYITLKKFNLEKKFKKDTILETNTKKIINKDLEITSSFLKYILSINGLEHLKIKDSEIFIEKDICIKNNSIKYFRFSPKNSDNLHCFYELINMMQGLKEINFESTESITFRRSINRFFYITELILCYINKMIQLLKLSEYDENFDFKTTDNDISASKCPSESLKLLFVKYNLSSIKKLCLCFFSISKCDQEALRNLINLRELKMYKIDLQNIFFSELFCTSLEYKIKRLRFVRTNIFERDLTFIANLKKLKELYFKKVIFFRRLTTL
ncbi:hypothetical protein CWI38_0544p0030 [Hamiltosporidium tvaerminnensis]|uniref:Uncharacterized protein n=1 Tax=Hamiltosporidium tvaerminnensis TaxID=1176355 RepID=A0A4Q9LXJ8_9MICR|nr:hypothetical protein CWI38_0544p0030 [Hamiltosporidium tvaerminnensis]